MPSGGARVGAGRKPKAVKFARPIAQAEKRIADRLPKLIDRMFELADGVLMAETLMDGELRVYRERPDRQALEYLINRILGKPVERQELTGDGGGPLTFEVTPIDYRALIAPLAPGPVDDRAASGEDEGLGDGAALG